jgi:hypothetical protein
MAKPLNSDHAQREWILGFKIKKEIYGSQGKLTQILPFLQFFWQEIIQLKILYVVVPRNGNGDAVKKLSL